MSLIGSFNANSIKEYVTSLQGLQRLVISGESYLKTTIPSMILSDQTSGTQPEVVSGLDNSLNLPWTFHVTTFADDNQKISI